LPQRAQRTQRFLASLVFLAKPAFKASFVAVYCLRPQGHRNGLFHKPAKNGSCKTRRHEENSHEKAQKTQRKIRQDKRIFLPQRAQRTQSLLNLTKKASAFASIFAKASSDKKATADRLRHEEYRRGFRRLSRILFLPADADLAAAFSIPVSVKPLAGVRWAIRDGPHKNMQAGKKGIL